ncbi:M20/M25/M40 family metallo-hydrolase [Candidatus Daviesbacteria bacterium]|nr:M20/M25/M40 family metallo-hydrolase [Candidatus Daviesbacteria bacterium]
MKQIILDLANKLISIPSTKNNSKALQEVLDIASEKLNGFNVKKFSSKKIPSALYYNTPTLPKKFKIILNAHLDVVPDKEYRAEERGGKLYGRGTYDMKAAAAVEVLVFANLAQRLNYPVGLQLVTDEEVSGYHGTRYQVEQGIRADFVIAGEPTNFGVNNKAKGVLWAKIKTKGLTAHGAYPWHGQNAIWQMKKFLDKLEKRFPEPKSESWVTTVNVASIECSNKTFNKVADDCVISLDIRYIPEDKDTVQDTIKLLLPKGMEMEVLEFEPPQSTNEKNPYVVSLQKATEKITGKLSPIILKHGASDIRFYDSVRVAGVTFGPIGAGLHSDEEWVDIDSLDNYYKILMEFLLSQK